jgi:hypothetical protein
VFAGHPLRAAATAALAEPSSGELRVTCTESYVCELSLCDSTVKSFDYMLAVYTECSICHTSVETNCSDAFGQAQCGREQQYRTKTKGFISYNITPTCAGYCPSMPRAVASWCDIYNPSSLAPKHTLLSTPFDKEKLVYPLPAM